MLDHGRRRLQSTHVPQGCLTKVPRARPMKSLLLTKDFQRWHLKPDFMNRKRHGDQGWREEQATKRVPAGSSTGTYLGIEAAPEIKLRGRFSGSTTGESQSLRGRGDRKQRAPTADPPCSRLEPAPIPTCKGNPPAALQPPGSPAPPAALRGSHLRRTPSPEVATPFLAAGGALLADWLLLTTPTQSELPAQLVIARGPITSPVSETGTSR